MKKFFTPVRRRKGMIDITEIGRQEQLLYAVAHKDDWLKEKFPEAHIVEPYQEPTTSLPHWLPETKRVSVWKAITSEIINLAKI